MHILGRSLRKRGVDQSHDYVTMSRYSVLFDHRNPYCERSELSSLFNGTDFSIYIL